MPALRGVNRCTIENRLAAGVSLRSNNVGPYKRRTRFPYFSVQRRAVRARIAMRNELRLPALRGINRDTIENRLAAGASLRPARYFAERKAIILHFLAVARATRLRLRKRQLLTLTGAFVMKNRAAISLAIFGLVCFASSFHVLSGQVSADQPVDQLDSLFHEPDGGAGQDPFGGSDEPDDNPFDEPGQVAATKVQKQQTRAATKATNSRASIKDELLKVTDVDFDLTTLEDAVDMIKEQHPIPIVVDVAAFDLAGLSASDETITLNLSGTSLRSSLRLMLKPLDCTYVVKDEVLLITTIEEADQYLVTEIYPVVDLVSSKDSSSVARSVDMLIGMLVRTVSPETWENVGGIGGISYYRGQLVVAQTGQVHEEIVALLAKLRQSIKTHGGLELPLPDSSTGGGGGPRPGLNGGGSGGFGGGGGAEGGGGGGVF